MWGDKSVVFLDRGVVFKDRAVAEWGWKCEARKIFKMFSDTRKGFYREWGLRREKLWQTRLDSTALKFLSFKCNVWSQYQSDTPKSCQTREEVEARKERNSPAG